MQNPVNNIDIFNASAALIFSVLYKNVPVPTTLNYNNLSSRILRDDDTAPREKILEVFINTVSWLNKSGYIWLDAEGELDVFGALLSPKGLEVLTIVPESSNSGETIGARLVSLEDANDNDNLIEERASLVKIAIAAGGNDGA